MPRAMSLVVIDMQRIFAEPKSQWYVSNYPQVQSAIDRLRSGLGEPVVWTRFVRDPAEQGVWADYYERWDECRAEPDAADWDLTLRKSPDDHVVSLPTFSKWGPELQSLTEGQDHLVVAGVATDCCVLSTVLGAIDAGKWVTVVTDACGGATAEAHRQTLALLELLSPMVSLKTIDEVLREAEHTKAASLK